MPAPFLGDWQGKLVRDDWLATRPVSVTALLRLVAWPMPGASPTTYMKSTRANWLRRHWNTSAGLKELRGIQRPATGQTAGHLGSESQAISGLHQCMLAHRQKVPDGSGAAKARNYSLKRWEALTLCPPTTTGWKTRYWDVLTGCSRDHYAAVSLVGRS